MNDSSVAQPPPNLKPPRPFPWSVRREWWENPSIYIAPLIVAAIIVLGILASAHRLPDLRRKAMLLDEVHRNRAIEMPYTMVAAMIIVTAFVVGFFYCLDALYGERRDRSILFWKSLPVSDVTAVLAKATVPMLILPAVAFVVIVVTQMLVLLVSSVALASSGLYATTWQHVHLLRQSVILLYGLGVITLWHAPIYGWALFVSSWARRATFLCAVVPFMAVGFFEKVTFGTSHFWGLVQHRFDGFAPAAFALNNSTHPIIDSFDQLTPGKYFSTPGLWGGLVITAVCLFIAIRFRRDRGPL